MVVTAPKKLWGIDQPTSFGLQSELQDKKCNKVMSKRPASYQGLEWMDARSAATRIKKIKTALPRPPSSDLAIRTRRHQELGVSIRG